MPAGSGRKRGRGPQHLSNLLKVVDLLLDLADTSSVQGWKAIQATSKAHEYNDLEKALVVRWDENRLLVTSSRKDPDEESQSEPIRHSNIGSLEAIRRCLKATEPKVMTRKLNLQGRKADTSEADFATGQIRTALNNLADLKLREDTEKRKPGAKRANSPHWSFWIVFPPNHDKRKQDCLTFIETRWNEDSDTLKERKTNSKTPPTNLSSKQRRNNGWIIWTAGFRPTSTAGANALRGAMRCATGAYTCR